MKILIFGSNGQVGHALANLLSNHKIIPLTRKDCDLNYLSRIDQSIDFYKPNLIINSAAYTDVDFAEQDEKLALRINSDAPKIMAKKANEYDIPFIHFSTDYVFDGKKTSSYLEDDFASPLNIYGKSKLAGEKAVIDVGGQFYIFRTSWVYSNIGNNFFLNMKKLSQKHQKIKVINSQLGVPTSNIFIANQLKKIIGQLNKNNSGIYHLVPDGKCSWFEFAKTIIEQVNKNFNIESLLPISEHEYINKTPRPKNSVLNNSKTKKTFMLKFESWQTELKKIINEA